MRSLTHVQTWVANALARVPRETLKHHLQGITAPLSKLYPIPQRQRPQLIVPKMASDVHTNTPWKDSEPRMQPDSRFLSLPAELIFAIVAQLSYDRHALCQLAQTCRLIHPCCEEHIYHTIELLRTRDLVAICKAFHSRPQRIAAVHKLGILYKYQRGIGRSSAVRKVFNGCLSKMTALREWCIQSPFDNFKWGTAASKEWVEGDMESFRQCLEKASLRNEQALQGNIGLSRLEKCTSAHCGALRCIPAFVRDNMLTANSSGDPFAWHRV